MIEWTATARFQLIRNPPEYLRPGHHFSVSKSGPDAFENRPKRLSLLSADPCLSAQPGDIPIGLPSLQLPGIDDLGPFAKKEMGRKPMPLNFS